MRELQSQIAVGLERLPRTLREWTQAHMCQPTAIRALLDPDKTDVIELLQLTRDTGTADSSCAVVYDPAGGVFGLVTRLEDSRVWYMGRYGTFDEAVANM